MFAAERGSAALGAESAASPLSVPYALSGTAGMGDPLGTDRPRSEDSGTAPSVEYDTSPPRGACDDFLRAVRDREVTLA
ncbi:hypothetical protein ALMP_16030 [Streptomyces sp. A012304]|nr:hypothetical protein ALMP_16030 [Streptomyces sp. A012304]